VVRIAISVEAFKAIASTLRSATRVTRLKSTRRASA
jgi:hypothetical protein